MPGVAENEKLRKELAASKNEVKRLKKTVKTTAATIQAMQEMRIRSDVCLMYS